MVLRGLFSRLGLGGGQEGEFRHAKTETDLFTKTNPVVDGEECLHDCENCSVKLPTKFSIDESAQLYGHIKPFQRHLVVATGQSDWVSFIVLDTRQGWQGWQG
jgi:hypothetical protein